MRGVDISSHADNNSNCCDLTLSRVHLYTVLGFREDH